MQEEVKMELMNRLSKTGHEEVIFRQKEGVQMILAYHTAGNGTTFGGIRLLPDKADKRAVTDALRLSEAMTYKLAMIDEPYGGSKAAVLLPPEGKSERFLHQVGEFIEQEKGRFITAIDSGFEPDDAKVIRERTRFILAIKDSAFGQSGVTTAYGILEGIKASLREAYGSGRIEGRSFAVQGLGSVGRVLAGELIRNQGRVYVSDTSRERIEEFVGEYCTERQRAEIVDTSGILSLDVDVLSPCGPPYVINGGSIPGLRCRIIAGGANCQLDDENPDDRLLFEKGILAAPDYVINAGGVIAGIEEFRGNSLEDAVKRLPVIRYNLERVYHESKKQRRGTYAVARDMANKKMAGCKT